MFRVDKVYYNDIPVGAVCCRLEQVDAATKESKLYIMTMGVLAPYRSLGLGTYAIKHLIDAASASTNKPYIKSLYLHVQVSNDSAKKFYERNGFKETKVVEDYYKKIEPKAAWMMEYEMPPRPVPTSVEGAEDGAIAAGSKAGKGGEAKQGGGAKNPTHGKGGKKRR
ncbi:hypothetical protein FRC17_007772 [Serendipita sp. 399]|nr:hypothetical protein FRC17_007772 [Serendipita sp. 399]